MAEKSGTETFADRLQALRERAGLTQYRLAQLSGITKQTLSRLELGKTQPTWDTVQTLAAALQVDVGAFVTHSSKTPDEAPPSRPRGRPPKDDAPPATPSTPPAAELEEAAKEKRSGGS